MEFFRFLLLELRIKGWLESQQTISTRSSINSRIIDESKLRSAKPCIPWFPVYCSLASRNHRVSHLSAYTWPFAPPWTVFFKLSDRLRSRQYSTCRGRDRAIGKKYIKLKALLLKNTWIIFSFHGRKDSAINCAFNCGWIQIPDLMQLSGLPNTK